MSYATTNPPRLISQGVGASTGSLWHYTDGDPIALVIAADYISNGDDLGLKVNDTILITDETLGQIETAIVSAVTAQGAATLSLRQTAKAEVLITTKVISPDESGTTFYLTLAGGFQVDLPPVELGLKYKFVVAVDPGTAYVIVTDSGDDIMIGGINELEVTTGNDGPYDINADTLNFVAAIAVVGDFVVFESDGTNWYFYGQTNADGGVTTSTT